MEARGSSDSSSSVLPRMVDNQILGRELQTRTPGKSRLIERKHIEPEPGAPHTARDTSSVDESLHRRFPRRVYYEYYQKRQSPTPASGGPPATPSGTPDPNASGS